jgi:hypothetical protein
MARVVRKTFKVDGVPTNVTSAKLSDPTGTFGVKRNDTDAVVVADNTSMTLVSTGTYQYEFADLPNVAYTAYVEFVYGGSTYHFEVDFAASASVSGGGPVSYLTLRERVGHYLFGAEVGTVFAADQLTRINYCIRDGLSRVYAAHEWSFFRPLVDVTTTEPYATGTITIAAGVVTLVGGTFPSWAASGVLMVGSKYYSVASRGSNTQITLGNTSVTQATSTSYKLAMPEVAMDVSFDSVANDSDLVFYPGPDQWYPSVSNRHDSTIRKLETDNPEFSRPCYYSVRTSRFDPAVGSRKTLAFYPAPDAAYTMRVPMILRPVELNESSLFPVGGEMLSQVILEACLAAAEHNYEEREHVHEKRFLEMIALAIRNDMERSSPTSLGPDAPRGEYGNRSVFDYDYRSREQRIGRLTIGGQIQ